ncbi:MAG TPA: AraC family transcriptional regulator [Phycisphaerae bacterium]|nr:AraC family transcriptional regulator [Phycisphaerae bacterium]HPS53014.1 AraC family transcriptional regulator [Phycisphaerae bacterium]
MLNKNAENGILPGFLDKLRDATPFIELFAYLPDVYFFVKNRQGRFIHVNDIMIEQCGCDEFSQVFGRTDFDFFPHELAQEYVNDDRKVLEKGIHIVNKVELVKNRRGEFNWFLTTKMPLISTTGKIIGLAGYTRDLRRSPHSWRPFETMAPVVEHIRRNLFANIPIGQLAHKACLSVSQFERRFKKIFNISPGRYIMRMKLLEACRELVETQRTISEIANRTGFYDHSAFTRYFTKLIGMTPKAYRRKFLRINVNG